MQEPKDNSPNTETANIFYSLNFKWKKERWYVLMLFHFCLTLLLATDRIIESKSWGNTSKLVIMALGLPICLTMLAYYTYNAIKEKKDYSEVIKDKWFRYLKIGVFTSLSSFALCLIALMISHQMNTHQTLSKAMVFSILGICIIFGITSSVFISMYEFCSNFDIFYHKNKETIIAEHLLRQQKLKITKEQKNDVN